MTILHRVKEIYIGYDVSNKVTLSGVKSASWKDSDPFVILPVPASDNIHIYQEIKPILWEIRLVCLDVTSLYTAFYDTDVAVAGGNQYAINPTTQKRTKIEYFKIRVYDHAGNLVTYNVTDARVKSIEIGELAEKGGETPWIVTLYAKKVLKE